MSAEIDIFKMKFSVFGRGFEDDRADSGEGAIILNEYINFGATYAAIDSTGQYIWLCGPSGIKKFDIETLEEVSTGSITTDQINASLYHPTNVANNYGVFFAGGNGETITVYIFNLTDNTIIKSGTLDNIWMGKADCLFVDGEFRFVSLTQSRANNYITRLKLSDLSVSRVDFANNPKNGSCGWVNNSNVFSYYVPEWFYQYVAVFGIGLSGALTWYKQAGASGGSGFPNLNVIGWGNNGYVWLPCYKYGKWRIGAFVPSSATDFETPAPKKVFGTFPSRPYLPEVEYSVAHNIGRTKVAFLTNLGVYMGDYHDMIKLTDEEYRPLAMDDKTVACSDGNTRVYIYKG